MVIDAFHPLPPPAAYKPDESRSTHHDGAEVNVSLWQRFYLYCRVRYVSMWLWPDIVMAAVAGGGSARKEHISCYGEIK